MAFKNYKFETDADGIALVTWDIPGRSMNVLDETSVNELEAIVKQTTEDAAIKGVVITSSKEAFCAGADLSMLEGMSHTYAELLKQKGEVAANQTLFDQSRRFSQVFRNIETSGKPWVAAINGLALGGGFDAVAIQSHPEIEKINYVHHAGNSSGIVDGAGAVLLGSKQAGAKHGLKPRAKIRAFANIGSEPAMMLTGPVDVTEKLFERSGMKKSDIDLFELNEAFASVVLRYMQAFDIDNAKINVNGGAIALGHPLGATGAMILGTVLDELERTNKSTALVTLCIGGGMGTATIIERV